MKILNLNAPLPLLADHYFFLAIRGNSVCSHREKCWPLLISSLLRFILYRRYQRNICTYISLSFAHAVPGCTKRSCRIVYYFNYTQAHTTQHTHDPQNFQNPNPTIKKMGTRSLQWLTWRTPLSLQRNLNDERKFFLHKTLTNKLPYDWTNTLKSKTTNK